MSVPKPTIDAQETALGTKVNSHNAREVVDTLLVVYRSRGWTKETLATDLGFKSAAEVDRIIDKKGSSSIMTRVVRALRKVVAGIDPEEITHALAVEALRKGDTAEAARTAVPERTAEAAEATPPAHTRAPGRRDTKRTKPRSNPESAWVAIGHEIQQYLETNTLSRKDFGNIFNVSAMAVSHWIDAAGRPDPENRDLLATVLRAEGLFELAHDRDRATYDRAVEALRARVNELIDDDARTRLLDALELTALGEAPADVASMRGAWSRVVNAAQDLADPNGSEFGHAIAALGRRERGRVALRLHASVTLVNLAADGIVPVTVFEPHLLETVLGGLRRARTADTPAPEPVVADTPAPEPVVADTPAPEPAVTDTPAPEPVVADTPVPEPAVTDTPAPVGTDADAILRDMLGNVEDRLAERGFAVYSDLDTLTYAQFRNEGDVPFDVPAGPTADGFANALSDALSDAISAAREHGVRVRTLRGWDASRWGTDAPFEIVVDRARPQVPAPDRGLGD